MTTEQLQQGAPPTGYVVALGGVSRGDSPRVGAKAANLGELARAGFPVPDGFIITAAAFERFFAANGLAPDAAPDQVIAAPLPPDVAGVVRDAVARLGDVPLAVRSSGVAEDLPGASFAGQYETVLDVRGPGAVCDAVRRCWASASGERVAAYRARRAQAAAAMAVLVQRLVPAQAAGVAFTANPVTGARDETLVSAVKGLGERLVSGHASPDEWVVCGDDAVCRAAPEGALDPAQALAVADLARRVQAHFGGVPQDVEWAISGDGTPFLLQARPITALPEPAPEPIPVPVEVPPGFWEREASHFPRPLSPLSRSCLLPAEAAALRHVFDEFSLLVETIEHREIGGWIYQRLVPLGGRDAPAPPAWLMPLLVRLVPRLRDRIRRCVEAVRSDTHGRLIERWYDEWYPEAVARIGSLRTIDIEGLSDEALDHHAAEVLRFTSESIDRHFLLHGALCLILGNIAFTCRDLLDWDDQRTLDLLNGLSTKSTEPGRALAGLADLARSRPAVRQVLEGGEISDATAGAAVERLAEVDPEFAAAFAAYQSEYGCRALSYDVADPTVAETPSLSLALLRDQLVRGYAPDENAAKLERRREAAVAEARAALAARPAADRQRFERALARAERAYPVREDNEWYTVSAPIALLRYAWLEVGRRLAERGQIARRDDVFFLEAEEARTALRDGSDRRPLVDRRRGERAWVEAHPGPHTYGRHPGPPPSFAALPAEARFAMEALLWVTGHIFAAEQSGRTQADGTTLRGIAASAGRYTGTVRVILTEAEFGRLKAGDVLVCPITSPVWSVLFPSVGALVTDTGGILSHAAIIAREYRVPAVVAAGDATRRLHDGQVVTVDGATGVVELQAAG